MTERRLVIGVGNPDRGDDAIGRMVARRLKSKAGQGIEICELNGEITAILERLESADAVCLVDAAISEASPGTIRRFECQDKPLPQAALSLSSQRSFERAMCRVFGANTQPDAQELNDFWSLIVHNDGRHVFFRNFNHFTRLWHNKLSMT